MGEWCFLEVCGSFQGEIMSYERIYERLSNNVSQSLQVGDGMGDVLRTVLSSVALEFDYQESQREKLMEMIHMRINELMTVFNRIAEQPGVDILNGWKYELEEMLFQSGKEGWPHPRAKTIEPE